MKAVVVHSELLDPSSPDEQDTLVQVDAVGAALRSLGDDVSTLAFSEDVYRVKSRLNALKPDFVFNLVESVNGRGELAFLAPVLFTELGVPYTGCGGNSLYLTTDKVAAKQILRRAGLPTPVQLTSSSPDAECEAAGGGKYIIKAAAEDASIGLEEDCVVTVESGDALRKLIQERNARSGMKHFAEGFVDGREFNIAVLARGNGFEVLPAAEILFDTFPEGKERIVGYKAKWDPDTFEYINTPRSYAAYRAEPALCAKLAGLSVSCCELFELQDYIRVDFRIDQSGAPWVLEMNPSPCISPDSGFVAAANEAGMSYEKVISRITERVRGR